MPSSTIAERPLILSMGDPLGIGPEIVARAWQQREQQQLPAFAVCGAREAFPGIPVIVIEALDEAAVIFPKALPVLLCDAAADDSGAIAIAALDHAASCAIAGQARALVTAPVHKARAYAAGFKWPGQTEYLAHRCGVTEARTAMMLAGADLRTVPLTIHVPLMQVMQHLTVDLVVQRARVVHHALKQDFAIASPKMVLAGLNPHAGEGGSIGDEEQRILAPALGMLRAQGIDIKGPMSADTLFHPAARAHYDVALCCTHDQALIPVKTIAFDSGVNITLGLPIIRTSPDHGTADDIAGRGIANPGAMIAAIKMADFMAQHRHG